MKTAHHLAILGLLFLATRLLWFNLEGDLFLTKFPHQDDAPGYTAMAAIFRGDGTYESHNLSPFTRVPLWPALLALTQLVVGPTNYPAFFLLLNALQAAVILLVYHYLHRQYTRRAAFWVTLTLIFFFDFALYSFLLRAETLFTLILLLATLSFLHTANHLTTRSALLTGLLFGLATLTRPVALLAIIPLNAILLFQSPQNIRSTIRTTILLASAFALTLSPWLIRNYRLTSSFLIQQDTGNIYYATLPGGHYEAVPTSTVVANIDDKTDLEIDRELSHAAISRITTNPAPWIKNSLHNFFYRLWSLGFIDTHLRYFEYTTNTGGYHKTATISPLARLATALNPTSTASTAPTWHHLYLIGNNIIGFSLIPLSLLGLILLPFFPTNTKRIGLILLYFWGITSLFAFSGSRYMVPLVPLLALIVPAYPGAVKRLAGSLRPMRSRQLSHLSKRLHHQL